MNYRFLYFIVGSGVMMSSVLVPGCVTGEFNHTTTEDVFINEAYTYEDGDELVILGHVKRGLQNCCDSARGHVDIALLAHDGTVIDSFSTLYSPGNIPKVRSRSSNFKVRRPYLPPDGVIIRMAYHNSLEGADSALYVGDVFQCEENKATPQHNDGQYKDIITKTGRAASQIGHNHRTHVQFVGNMR
ncbi:MAG: hypothetical protein H8D56_24285 [Planctomycetes bacterium]|nr:hypothetical protein [Planctomycetota bacterium]